MLEQGDSGQDRVAGAHLDDKPRVAKSREAVVQGVHELQLVKVVVEHAPVLGI